jgi:tetratricopeptide (TPR) repeat protein
MKNNILLIALMSFMIGFAQQSKMDEITFQKSVLKKAKEYSDPAVTKSAFYKLIVLQGESSTYKDSLAYLYYSGRQYAQCYLVSEEILKKSPNKVQILEIQAASLETLGAYDKALARYEKLFTLKQDNYHGYSLANLQYRAKKYNEALITIQKTEKLNDTGDFMVTYPINKTHSQKVELMAAIQYLKGLISIELDRKEMAKISLQKAIKIHPDFVLAKEKLEEVNEK